MAEEYKRCRACGKRIKDFGKSYLYCLKCWNSIRVKPKSHTEKLKGGEKA
jgi:translation initiation factor 2 beta subunit (eIF-2beta)/eIF-5